MACETAQPHVRASAAKPPKQLLNPPYELRPEMNWIDFSGSANPLGTPPSFIRAMQGAIAAGQAGYVPDRESHAFRSALSRRYGLSMESFLVGSSVCDMIRAVAQTFEPCTVGIPVPGPAEYALVACNAGHEAVELRAPAGFVIPDLDCAQGPGRPIQAAILANPLYPTSRLLSRSTLCTYLEACDWVVVDERSIELTIGGESMVALVADHPNLVVVHSLSESFALPGVPISYCIAQPQVIDQIAQFYDRSGVSMFAEVLGSTALAEQGYLDRTREFLEREIPWLQCRLELIPGVGTYPAEANFLMCRYDPGPRLHLGAADTKDLTNKLQLAGFMVRRLNGRTGLDRSHFCVAVRSREENERLVEAMGAIIGQDPE